MELKTTVAVAAPPDAVLALLGDPRRTAHCLPGAAVHPATHRSCRGELSLARGPVALTYAGSLQVHRIEAHRVVLQAAGAGTNREGEASATVTASVAAAAGGSQVELVALVDLGRAEGRFGRSVLVEVMHVLLDEFGHNLAAAVTDDGSRRPFIAGRGLEVRLAAGAAGMLLVGALLGRYWRSRAT